MTASALNFAVASACFDSGCDIQGKADFLEKHVRAAGYASTRVDHLGQRAQGIQSSLKIATGKFFVKMLILFASIAKITCEWSSHSCSGSEGETPKVIKPSLTNSALGRSRYLLIGDDV
jgi:hypothetical protein